MSLLSVTNLTKTFSQKFTAVDSISFDVKPGENVGLLGPNGAGKTTTIQMLLGTLTPTSGTITYFGKDFARYRSKILEAVTYASAYVKLPAHLTIAQNLEIFARLYGLNAAQRAQKITQLLKRFDLQQYRDKKTLVLSAGQTTRLMLAKAFLPNPKVVLLDEPTASLDPDVAESVRNFVKYQQQEHGTAFVFTSHNMAEVAAVCNRVLVLKKGTIIANNTPDELARSVARSRVRLMVGQQLRDAERFGQEKDIAYTVKEHEIIFEIDEQQVAHLLQELAARGISYAQISIDKPTLEDYFISVARQ